jgi:Fe-S oxidoreductase
LRKWVSKNEAALQPNHPIKEVLFFIDEFTNFNDTPIGITAIQLLVKLGFKVVIVDHMESGRTYLSKGLLDEAKEIASRNVGTFHPIVSAERKLIGLEPSAILTFRDEYPDLLRGPEADKAKELAANVLTVEEFLAEEMQAGNITSDQFMPNAARIRLHGHCHQKALSSVIPTKQILSLPAGYEVLMIPSGCCGMAGSFGYEEKHYDISMKIGELVLFPAIREEADTTIIAAPGTSCRHQIMDGTGRVAKHPVEILYEALI